MNNSKQGIYVMEILLDLQCVVLASSELASKSESDRYSCVHVSKHKDSLRFD